MLYCDNCSRPLQKKKYYTLRVDLFLTPHADKEGRIVIENDTSKSLEDLVAEMEDLSQYLSEEEINEMQDEIAETYRFYLCTECRKKMHQQLREHFIRRFWR